MRRKLLRARTFATISVSPPLASASPSVKSTSARPAIIWSPWSTKRGSIKWSPDLSLDWPTICRVSKHTAAYHSDGRVLDSRCDVINNNDKQLTERSTIFNHAVPYVVVFYSTCLDPNKHSFSYDFWRKIRITYSYFTVTAVTTCFNILPSAFFNDHAQYKKYKSVTREWKHEINNKKNRF